MGLYLKFLRLHLKSALQYKLSFVLTAMAQFFISFNSFIAVLFIFYRFPSIKTYSFSEVLLCFSIVLMSYSLTETFMRGFDTFSRFIINGDFDRFLLRPRSLVWQVVCGRVEFSKFAKISQATIMLVYGIVKTDIDWNFSRILTLILMIAGGVIVFSCLFLIYASLCFFTLEGLELMNILTDGAKEHGKYPIDIYGKRVLRFCTYIVPYSLFQYYPFLYLTGRTDKAWYGLLPLLTLCFVIPCYLLWRFGVRHYKSAGS